MKMRPLLMACGIALTSITAVAAGNAPDLSAFGDPVETNGPRPSGPSSESPKKIWPAYVCSEIQRMEKLVISGARPTDRGMTRIGLLLLEQTHCGIDVSKQLSGDQAILEKEGQKAQRDYEENIAAAARAASSPPEPIIVEIPQETPTPSIPAPSPTMQCFTNRLGGGMSTTTCR